MATNLRLLDALFCLPDSVLDVGDISQLGGQFLWRHTISQSLTRKHTYTYGFLRSHVRPRKLLLQLVGLVALLSRLLGLFEPSLGLLVGFLEVGDDLSLARQDLSRLTYILHARLILFAKLAQLRSFQEELVTFLAM